MTKRNEDRVRALAEGRKTYAGSVCARHPALLGERSVSQQCCIACIKERSYAVARTPAEQERSRVKGRKAAHSAEAWAARALRQEAARLARLLTKEGAAKHLLRVARRRRHEMEVSATLADVLAAWPADDRCPVFGTAFEHGAPSGRKRDLAPSLDRFDSSQGYTADNISVISWRANRIKQDSTLADLKLLTEWMARRG